MIMENSGMTIHPAAVPPLRRLELVGSFPIHGQRAADAQGRATIMREASASILPVTEAWARACRAPLEGSSQNRYELMPANYALRAVALDRGKHRLRPEQAPLAFHVAALLLWRRERRPTRA
jgi:hypothetical protein